jgi:acetylornithine deacetylase
MKEYVEDINANLDKLPTHGPCSKYELPAENLRGK